MMRGRHSFVLGLLLVIGRLLALASTQNWWEQLSCVDFDSRTLFSGWLVADGTCSPDVSPLLRTPSQAFAGSAINITINLQRDVSNHEEQRSSFQGLRVPAGGCVIVTLGPEFIPSNHSRANESLTIDVDWSSDSFLGLKFAVGPSLRQKTWNAVLETAQRLRLDVTEGGWINGLHIQDHFSYAMGICQHNKTHLCSRTEDCGIFGWCLSRPTAGNITVHVLDASHRLLHMVTNRIDFTQRKVQDLYPRTSNLNCSIERAVGTPITSYEEFETYGMVLFYRTVEAGEVVNALAELGERFTDSFLDSIVHPQLWISGTYGRRSAILWNRFSQVGEIELIQPAAGDAVVHGLGIFGMRYLGGEVVLLIKVGHVPGTYTVRAVLGNDGSEAYIQLEVLRNANASSPVRSEFQQSNETSVQEKYETFEQSIRVESLAATKQLGDTALERDLIERRLVDAVTACPSTAYTSPSCTQGRIICWQFSPGQFTSLCACPTCNLNPTSDFTCGNCNPKNNTYDCPSSLFRASCTAPEVNICAASNQGSGTYTQREVCSDKNSDLNHKNNYCGDCDGGFYTRAPTRIPTYKPTSSTCGLDS